MSNLKSSHELLDPPPIASTPPDSYLPELASFAALSNLPPPPPASWMSGLRNGIFNTALGVWDSQWGSLLLMAGVVALIVAAFHTSSPPPPETLPSRALLNAALDRDVPVLRAAGATRHLRAACSHRSRKAKPVCQLAKTEC